MNIYKTLYRKIGPRNLAVGAFTAVIASSLYLGQSLGYQDALRESHFQMQLSRLTSQIRLRWLVDLCKAGADQEKQRSIDAFVQKTEQP